MDVARARICVNALSRDGSRCGTRMSAMPGCAESAFRNVVKASSPPADAPTPTIGKLSRLVLFDSTGCSWARLPRVFEELLPPSDLRFEREGVMKDLKKLVARELCQR